MHKKFKWVVEFTIDQTWVEDGFNLTEERAKEMVESALPFSTGSETSVRILKAPDADIIREVQGE